MVALVEVALVVHNERPMTAPLVNSTARPPAPVASLDARVLERCASGEAQQAAALAIDAFAKEIQSFLAHSVGVELGREAFGEYCLDVCSGVARFAARSSLRTWCYTVARHAAQRVSQRERRHLRQADSAAISSLEAPVRGSTVPWLRTENKDKVRELRAALSQRERMLLALRVDRAMSWSEVAAILEPCAEYDLAAQRRSASRVRKQFERCIERLRELAAQHGVLGASAGLGVDAAQPSQPLAMSSRALGL